MMPRESAVEPELASTIDLFAAFGSCRSMFRAAQPDLLAEIEPQNEILEAFLAML